MIKTERHLFWGAVFLKNEDVNLPECTVIND